MDALNLAAELPAGSAVAAFERAGSIAVTAFPRHVARYRRSMANYARLLSDAA